MSDPGIPALPPVLRRLFDNWVYINSNPLTRIRQIQRRKKTNNRKMERQNRKARKMYR